MMTLKQATIKVDREQLLVRLRDNRVNHEAAYNEAYEDWKKQVQLRLEQGLERVKAGDFSQPYDSIAAPSNHLKDYDEAISMMVWSVAESIELDRDSFNAYINDKWSWTVGFAASAVAYKAGLSL